MKKSTATVTSFGGEITHTCESNILLEANVMAFLN